MVGSYTMAIQVFESTALPDSPSTGSGSGASTGGSGASGSAGGANSSSGSNGSTSGTVGGRVLGISEKMVAFGALVAMAAAGAL